MIYFFDINLKLKKIVTPENALEAVHEHELNNHIIGSMIMDMSYAKTFIDDVDHFGYYYKGNFYLHRIRRVEDSHISETVTVTGRHIFFEDMLYGLPIDDFRPQNRDAAYILKNTIDTNTRWRTVMTDVTGTLSTNFYRQVPWDVIEWVTENFRVEFEPVILFDGQKINGYQLHVANKLGVNKHKRIPFSRVTELDYEIDYSEIITSLAGYGKGEEVGDGYGRRINIADVDFSRNGVVSPIGSHYMEDENITAIYGKDNGEPKYGIVEFSDIEDDELLAEAMYESYLEMSRPKMAFSASVIDVGDVGIGDTQVIVRPEYDVFYSVRIHKMIVNLHDPEDADVELGDYEHFKESKVERKSRQADKEWKKRYASAIQELKRDWDADYNGIVEQIEQGYEQAVIDANANIQAAEVRMQEEIDTQRDAMEQEINMARQNAINEATQNAETKKQEVQNNLDTFKETHQELYEDVTGRITNIDEFIGDTTEPLNERLNVIQTEFESKLNNVDTWLYNMLRGTKFDEGFWSSYAMELANDGETKYFEFVPSRNESYVPYIQNNQEVVFQEGETYRLSFDFQTYAVREIDNIWLIATENEVEYSNRSIWHPNNHDGGTHLFANWGSEFNRYWLEFTMPYTMKAHIRIGANLTDNGEHGRQGFKIALPYLTTTDNTRWLYHQLDNTQNLEEITRRVTQLEDGREEFIARTEYDNKTGEIEGTVRNIKETVDGRESVIANHEDWITTNGSSVIQAVDEVNSKVWMDDIVNPNMLSHTDFSKVENRRKWLPWGDAYTGSAYSEFMRVRDLESGGSMGIESPPLEVIGGQTYTLSWIGYAYGDTVDDRFDYTYIIYSEGTNQGIYGIDRKIVDTPGGSYGGNTLYYYTATFTAPRTDENAGILIGARTRVSGIDASFAIKEPKLEMGSRATAYESSFSAFQQRADEMSLMVQEIDSNSITQSEVFIGESGVQIGSTYIGDNEFSSIFSVSPKTIDVITEQMRLTGDLLVQGDIESIAISAVTADFAEIFVDIADIGFIKGKHIDAGSITVDKLQGADAILEYLMARMVFADKVKTMSIEAVYADLRSVNSEIMTSNIIKSNWLDVDTALFNRFTASEAFIDRLEVKAVNVRDLEAITIDAVQANLTTVMNSMGEVEGGLSIRRPDGEYYFNNGMAVFDFAVQMTEFLEGSNISWNGQWYETQRANSQRCMIGSFKHVGRILRIHLVARLSGYSPSTSEYMYFQIRSYGSGITYQKRQRVLVYRGSSEGIDFTIGLPPITRDFSTFYLEMWRDGPDGTHTENIVQLRVNRAWIEG